MKIEVWMGEEKPVEPVLRLCLYQHSAGKVILRAVDEYGIALAAGDILVITEEGVRPCRGVGKKVNLPKGAEDRVKIIT